MGLEKQVDPKRIELHGQDVKEYVARMINAAGEAINGDGVHNLEGGDFSITCTLASAAYPVAVQFAFSDIKALEKEAEEMAQKLGSAALTYTKAEQRNMGQ